MSRSIAASASPRAPIDSGVAAVQPAVGQIWAGVWDTTTAGSSDTRRTNRFIPRSYTRHRARRMYTQRRMKPAQPHAIWRVIAAAAVGTMIEWYDFYIFGSLATIIAPLFYPSGNDALALTAYLSTFAVGFVVRPFGALVFGRIGDLVGRKYAFLVTLVLMGGSTALVGFLPVYASIGLAAPIALLLIR